jgi:hypothetical protein
MQLTWCGNRKTTTREMDAVDREVHKQHGVTPNAPTAGQKIEAEKSAAISYMQKGGGGDRWYLGLAEHDRKR